MLRILYDPYVSDIRHYMGTNPIERVLRDRIDGGDATLLRYRLQQV